MLVEIPENLIVPIFDEARDFGISNVCKLITFDNQEMRCFNYLEKQVSHLKGENHA